MFAECEAGGNHDDSLYGVGATYSKVQLSPVAGASDAELWVRPCGARDNADVPWDRFMTGAGYLERPAPSGLADVIEIILDKGVVIDAYVRVSLVGIELLTMMPGWSSRASTPTFGSRKRPIGSSWRPSRGRGLPELVSDVAGPVVENVASKVVEKKVEPVAKPIRKTIQAARTGVEKVKDAAEDVLGDADDDQGR